MSLRKKHTRGSPSRNLRKRPAQSEKQNVGTQGSTDCLAYRASEAEMSWELIMFVANLGSSRGMLPGMWSQRASRLCICYTRNQAVDPTLCPNLHLKSNTFHCCLTTKCFFKKHFLSIPSSPSLQVQRKKRQKETAKQQGVIRRLL